MKYKIIDNFLDKENFNNIKNLLMGFDFPWYYQPDITNKGKKSLNNSFYFFHLFYQDLTIGSNLYHQMIPLLKNLKVKSLIRLKANFYPNQNKFIEHEFHKDYDYTHKGCLFYINSNNGFTILKDGTKIESVENRALIFDPSMIHKSTNCTDERSRINININYF